MPIFFKKSKHVLIQLESDNDWGYFYDVCDGYLNDRHFKLIRDYLKDNAKTIVLEKEYFDADYRDTYYNFFSRKFAEYPSKTIRVNFFNKRIAPRMIYELDRYQDNYIGFSVIRPNRVSPIGRTVLDPKKIDCVDGHICMSEHAVHILGAELKAVGFPYMSQDTDVTICAHAACWMIFRYFSQRYSRYAETWPYEVTQLTTDVSMGRLIPSKGLTGWQVSEMFSHFGLYPEIYSRQNADHAPIFDKLLYMYIESGFPVVAALYKHQHAIIVVGHLSDFQNTNPQTPTTSDQYLKGFIVNDDNFMPYQVIRKDGPQPSGHWSSFKIEDIDFFVVPLYEKIHLTAEHVMKLSETILTDRKLGTDNCSNLIQYKNLITRTFLTSSKSFKKNRRENILPFGISKVYAEMSMPKFIWICEISTPDLFKKEKVVGEILFDATANQYDRFSFLSIHYPDFLLLNNRNYLTENPKRFIVHDVDTHNINDYNCYINNLCEV